MSEADAVDSILDTIGNTHLIQLQRVAPDNGCELLGKLEANNPAGSVKDRIGASMIRAAERAGELQAGDGHRGTDERQYGNRLVDGLGGARV